MGLSVTVGLGVADEDEQQKARGIDENNDAHQNIKGEKGPSLGYLGTVLFVELFVKHKSQQPHGSGPYLIARVTQYNALPTIMNHHVAFHKTIKKDWDTLWGKNIRFRFLMEFVKI